MLIGISDQMGTRFDRLRYEVFQNLILSPMNTGLLRPALQQSLPFTVLKLNWDEREIPSKKIVATVLTVYGIETHKTISLIQEWQHSCNSPYRLRYWNFDILGLNNINISCNSPYRLRYWNHNFLAVTSLVNLPSCNSPYRLRYWNRNHLGLNAHPSIRLLLQQSLPFTVLKLFKLFVV